MKSRTAVLTFVGLFVALSTCLAQDMGMGTWKLNEAQSKLSPGLPKNSMVVYEAAGDGLKVTVDGVDAQGKAIHNEWTGKYDGKDYPVTGDPTADTRSLKKMDDHTLQLVAKKEGKIIVTGRIVYSPDGQRRTLTISGTTAAGEKFESVSVYDKQ